MNPIARFDLQSWFFDDPRGECEIDLGESGIAARDFCELPSLRECDLDYGVDRGTVSLRTAIAAMYEVDPAEVIITHGSEEASFLANATLLDLPGRRRAVSGDEDAQNSHVITFLPGWQQAWEVPSFLGATVTKLRLAWESGFAINWNHVAQAIRPDTKLVALASPCSPMGTAYGNSDWQELRKLAVERQVTFINDEVYLRDAADSIVKHLPGSLAVSSLSKTFGFPGLRVGWCIGPKNIIDQMVNLKRYISVCNSPLCERLALDVLRMRPRLIQEYDEMRRVGLAIVKEWSKSESLDMVDAPQTPFAYVNVRNVPMPSIQIATHILEEKKVLTVPGEVFGDEHTLRISFGRPEAELREGLSRISCVLRALRTVQPDNVAKT